MGCGCNQSNSMGEAPRGEMVAAPYSIETRAAICSACPKGQRIGGRTVACTINNRPILANLTEGTCPLGRFPSSSGEVRWMGATWLGVPEPLRWLLVLRLGRNPSLPHCGCVAALKASRLAPWLSILGEASVALRERAAKLFSEFRAAMKDLKSADKNV